MWLSYANPLTSDMIVNAKASANPAVEALICGLRIATNPVAPTTALDSRLNRAESHRFAVNQCEHEVNYGVGERKWPTSPHPIVRVRILSGRLVNQRIEGKTTYCIDASEHVTQEL